MTSKEAIELLCALTGDHPANVREPDSLLLNTPLWTSDSEGHIALAVTGKTIALTSGITNGGAMILTGPVGAALARAFLAATNPKSQEV